MKMLPTRTEKASRVTLWKQRLLNNMLLLLTVLGVLIGCTLGTCIRKAEPSQNVVIWLGLPGEVYMRMLKMMILPLIICSVITGTASLDPKCNGRISVVSFIYIMTSNCLACILPMILSLTMKPGHGVNLSSQSVGGKNQKILETMDIFVDLVRNIFPDNIVTACFEQAQTTYEKVNVTARKELSGNLTHLVANLTNNASQPLTSGPAVNSSEAFTKFIETHAVMVVKGVGTASSTNVLGLVLSGMIFGMATASLGPQGKPFFEFFRSANEVIIKVLRWFVWTTPIGVASLITVAFLQTENLDTTVRSLGMFSLTVILSLAIHQFIIIALVFFLLVRENPYKFLLTLTRPYFISFAAASSAVSIPETLRTLEEKSNLDTRITRFVIPFATTINRDGSCVFVICSCVFVSQLAGVDLHAGNVVLLWFMTTVTSVAIPSVPSAGVVTVVICLSALGIPVKLAGLLFATEWIIDRFRSASNMLSHAHAAKVTSRFCWSYLPRLPRDPMTTDMELEFEAPMLKDGHLELDGHVKE